MKKLESILRGCEIVDKLFGLRQKQIKTAFAAARNDIEEQVAKAEIDYENNCRKLGDREVSNYKEIINRIVKAKAIITDGKTTLDVLNEVEADLESEVTPVGA